MYTPTKPTTTIKIMNINFQISLYPWIILPSCLYLNPVSVLRQPAICFLYKLVCVF